MATIKLAEALLRRKELQDKVKTLAPINVKDLFELRVERKPAAEGVDNITLNVPKITGAQVSMAYDWHAKQLRKVDAAIQQANWNTSVVVDDDVMADYVEPAKP